MKQFKKIENYLCLEARAQCRNKWMPWSKDQRLLFSDGERLIAITDDEGLPHELYSKLWSDPSDAFFFASTTFPKPPSPNILTGWKLSMDNFGWPIVSVWPETQSFNMLLRYRIYRCYNCNTIMCCSWWWWWWWWQ